MAQDNIEGTRRHLWFGGACEAVHLNAAPVPLTLIETIRRAAVNAHHAALLLSSTRSMTADHVDVEAKEATALIQFLSIVKTHLFVPRQPDLIFARMEIRRIARSLRQT